MNLTNEERKLLTEYIGECWQLHTPEYCHNRTFTTPADLHVVYSKMVEKGEFNRFRESAKQSWALDSVDNNFIAWLSCYGYPDQIGERMKMAAEWIERGKKYGTF